MEKVRGIGGIFMKGNNPEGLSQWYADHLGIPLDEWGGSSLPWRHADGTEEMTIWSVFKQDTEYLKPSDHDFMINYIVDDLDAMLAQLREKGATVVGEAEESEFGRFGWVMDPEGHKIELWQPPR